MMKYKRRVASIPVRRPPPDKDSIITEEGRVSLGPDPPVEQETAVFTDISDRSRFRWISKPGKSGCLDDVGSRSFPGRYWFYFRHPGGSRTLLVSSSLLGNLVYSPK